VRLRRDRAANPARSARMASGPLALRSATCSEIRSPADAVLSAARDRRFLERVRQCHPSHRFQLHVRARRRRSQWRCLWFRRSQCHCLWFRRSQCHCLWFHSPIQWRYCRLGRKRRRSRPRSCLSRSECCLPAMQPRWSYRRHCRCCRWGDRTHSGPRYRAKR
jgi:hypothetical protein